LVKFTPFLRNLLITFHLDIKGGGADTLKFNLHIIGRAKKGCEFNQKRCEFKKFPKIFVMKYTKIVSCKNIYLWRKVVCFVFVVMRSTEPGCFRSCSWCLWKALYEDGCMGFVPWHLDLWCKSSWILNDFFTEN